MDIRTEGPGYFEFFVTVGTAVDSAVGLFFGARSTKRPRENLCEPSVRFRTNASTRAYNPGYQ